MEGGEGRVVGRGRGRGRGRVAGAVERKPGQVWGQSTGRDEQGEGEEVMKKGEGGTAKSTVSSKKLSGHQSPCQSPRGEWEKERHREGRRV